ncbi:MAG: hypothetical protein AAFQ64_09065 [Pseudomonadota bacterium]
MIGSYLARQHLVALLLGAVLAFTGGANIFLLLQQNRLLKNQESIIAAQTIATRDTMISQDAMRYTALHGQLMQVLSDISTEALNRYGLEAYHLVELSPELSERIITLSITFRPYWYLDSFQPFDRSPVSISSRNVSPPMVFLSPERGLMLRSIIQNRVKLVGEHRVDFSRSDVRGASLEGALVGEGWDFQDAREWGSCRDISEASVMGTMAEWQMWAEYVEEGAMQPVKALTSEGKALFAREFGWMNIAGSDFSYSTLNGLSFNTSDVRLREANLINTSFQRVQSRLDLSGANIFSMQFDRALGTVPVEIIAQETNFFLYFCFGEADMGVLYDSMGASDDQFTMDAGLLNEFHQAMRGSVNIAGANFQGALVRDILVGNNFFPMLEYTDDGVDASTELNPRWRFHLFAVEP